MSDGAKARPGGTQVRSRGKRTARGGRNWQTRPTARTLAAIPTEPTDAAAPAVPATRRSRRTSPQVAVAALPREIEYAYIRSDLQRLAAIAAALLVLMMVILYIVER